MAAAAAAGPPKPRRFLGGKGPGTSLDVGSCSGTFVPPTDAVQAAVTALHALEDEQRAACIEAAVLMAREPGAAEAATAVLSRSCTGAAAMDQAITAAVGMLAVVREAVKRRTPFSMLEATLEAVNVPSAAASAFGRLVARDAAAIEAAAAADSPALPSLGGLRWRVDVQIASSSAVRVLRPSVMLELTLSDGSISTFAASVEQFSALRHGVAKTLKGVIEDEGHFVMRLTADMERAAQRRQGK